jgi:hypothetical protein
LSSSLFGANASSLFLAKLLCLRNVAALNASNRLVLGLLGWRTSIGNLLFGELEG